MELTKALVHKYESGECTAEEKAFVEQWLHTDSLSEEEKQYTIYYLNNANLIVT